MNDFKNYAATESEQRKIYDIEQTARPEMEFLARAAGVLLMYKTSTLLIGLMTAHDTLPQQKVSGQPQQIEVQAIRAKTLPQNTYVL
jgi:hypothetical protein